MAIQTILEKPGGSVDSMVQPVFVYDDAEAAITEATAKTQAETDAPASFFSVLQDANPGIERITPFAVRVFVGYRVFSPNKLTKQAIGQVRYNFDVRAESKVLRFAPEVARFPSGSTGAPDSEGLLVSTRGDNSFHPLGTPINAPPPNMGVEGLVAIGDVTAAWTDTVSTLVGRVNSVAIGSHAAGEIILVRVVARQRDDDSVHIAVGWNKKENVADETRGPVTAISYNGHHFVWEWTQKRILDGKTLMLVPKYVYVNEVWPTADITALGISPPS